VANLDDYWRWLEQLVDRSGGYFEDRDVLIVEAMEDDEGRLIALRLPGQDLRYYDGSYLYFGMEVEEDLELSKYHFHYARSLDELVWREDKHPGHEDLGPAHIHLPGAEDDPCPSAEVDLKVVLDRIWEDQGNR